MIKKRTEKNAEMLFQRTLDLAYFPHFWGKKHDFQKIWLSYTTLHGPLTPCRVAENTKEPISRKRLNRRTDRPHSFDPSGHGQESRKRISQSSGIAVDNNNKI